VVRAARKAVKVVMDESYKTVEWVKDNKEGWHIDG